jgi:hypothetical protein
MRQLTSLAATAHSVELRTLMEHNLSIERKHRADLQSRQVINKLEDIKCAVDLLGQLTRDSNRPNENPSDSSCHTLQKRSASGTYQAAIASTAEHIYQLLYLIYLSIRDLFQRALLLSPGLALILEVRYASLPRNPTWPLDENIRFVDAFGRPISLDYTMFKSWPVRTPHLFSLRGKLTSYRYSVSSFSSSPEALQQRNTSSEGNICSFVANGLTGLSLA